MRGRLIQRFLAEIARLDTADTAAVGSGSGYDDDFGDVALQPDGTQDGTPSRQEETICLPCQLKNRPTQWVDMAAAGQDDEYYFEVVFFMKDLEDRGLLDSNGRPQIKNGDRLVAIWTIAGELVMAFPNPPGVFVSRLEPSGWGLDMRSPKLNLVTACFRERRQG